MTFFHSESSKHPDAASLSNNSNPNGEIDASPKQHDALIIANGTNMENNSGMPQPLRNRQVVIDMSGNGCFLIRYCYTL